MPNPPRHRGTSRPGRSFPTGTAYRAGEHLDKPSNIERDPSDARRELRRLDPDTLVEVLAGEMAQLRPHQQVEVLQALAEVYRIREVDPTFAVDPDLSRGCLDLVAAIVRDSTTVPEVFLPDRRWKPPRQAAQEPPTSPPEAPGVADPPVKSPGVEGLQALVDNDCRATPLAEWLQAVVDEGLQAVIGAYFRVTDDGRAEIRRMAARQERKAERQARPRCPPPCGGMYTYRNGGGLCRCNRCDNPPHVNLGLRIDP